MEVNREQETQKQVINMKVKVKKKQKKNTTLTEILKVFVVQLVKWIAYHVLLTDEKKKDLDEIFISLFIFFTLV